MRSMPRTLDQCFNALNNTMLKINRPQVEYFLFEYACNLCDIEKLNGNLEEEDSDNFRDFVMRNKLEYLTKHIMGTAIKMEHPENFKYVPPEPEHAVRVYLADPFNDYIHDAFGGYQHHIKEDAREKTEAEK